MSTVDLVKLVAGNMTIALVFGLAAYLQIPTIRVRRIHYLIPTGLVVVGGCVASYLAYRYYVNLRDAGVDAASWHDHYELAERSMALYLLVTFALGGSTVAMLCTRFFFDWARSIESDNSPSHWSGRA